MVTVARLVRAHGRVQGVFFRDSTRRRAAATGVTGWVRNDPDGSVTAWLEGQEGSVDALEHWIRDGGPPHARVVGVEVVTREPEGHEEFRIRY